MTNANPSLDPANTGTLTGLLKMGFNKMMQNTNNCLPAKIVAYDRTTNRAQVQPLISLLATDGTLTPRAAIASVPVVQYGGGGFILSFNLKPGDLGWIEACDRDISLFLQNYKESGPNTQRIHDFADSKFHPDVMTGYTIAEEDEENAVLQTLDGSVRISIFPDKVKITAPTLEVDGNLQLTGETTLTGDLRVNGNITASGDITPNVP